jgi:hypothetical protein
VSTCRLSEETQVRRPRRSLDVFGVVGFLVRISIRFGPLTPARAVGVMTSTPPMTSLRLAPAPALDLASLRLDAGAVLFGRLDPPLEGSAPERGALARCLHVTVRLEGDGGVARATTACRASAHDAYDPDDPSDDRSRWWRSVVPPFHDARPRPSPGPVAPAVARDFALQLDDAEVGARGVLTVAVSPEARRACVLLREPFEIARAAHEFPPKRLPSVVDACGAAYAETMLSAEPRARLAFFPPVLVLLVAGGALLALLAAAVSSPAVVFRLAETACRIRRRASATAERWHASVSELAARIANPPLPLRRPRLSKAPLGAWRVKRLLRERSAGRPPFPPRGAREMSNATRQTPVEVIEDDDGFLFDAQATWSLKAVVTQNLEDVEHLEDAAFAFNPKTKRNLVRAFLAAPPIQDSFGNEWDSSTNSSCAMTDVTETELTGKSPDACFAVAYGGFPVSFAATFGGEKNERNAKFPRKDISVDSERGVSDSDRSRRWSHRSNDRSNDHLREHDEEGLPFLVRMFGGGADVEVAEPKEADLRVFAYDVHCAGAFQNVALISVAGGTPDERLEVLFPGKAASAPTRTRTSASSGSGSGSGSRERDPADNGERGGLRGDEKRRRRTSAAFEFREVSESPLDFAEMADRAAGKVRRAREE